MSRSHSHTEEELLQILLGKTTWMRAAKLGVGVIVLFILGAGVAYILTTLAGWGLEARLIVSLLIGPIFGSVFFAVYWLIKRPNLSTIPESPEKAPPKANPNPNPEPPTKAPPEANPNPNPEPPPKADE